MYVSLSLYIYIYICLYVYIYIYIHISCRVLLRWTARFYRTVAIPLLLLYIYIYIYIYILSEKRGAVPDSSREGRAINIEDVPFIDRSSSSPRYTSWGDGQFATHISVTVRRPHGQLFAAKRDIYYVLPRRNWFSHRKRCAICDQWECSAESRYSQHFSHEDKK